MKEDKLTWLHLTMASAIAEYDFLFSVEKVLQNGFFHLDFLVGVQSLILYPNDDHRLAQ